VAWRAAVSAIAGLLVSAFAAAALLVGTVGSIGGVALDTMSASLAPMLSAMAGTGLIASTVVLLCLLMNDVRRSAGPWFLTQRRHLLLPLRAITWGLARITLATVAAFQLVARSSVVTEFLWLVRTVAKALGWALALIAVAGVVAAMYVGTIAIGLACVGQSTHILIAILDDPPRQEVMALGVGAATFLMYLGLGAFAVSVWIAARLTRRGLQGAHAMMAVWRR